MALITCACGRLCCRGSYTFDQPAIEQGDKLVQAVVTADNLLPLEPIVVPPVTVTVPNLPVLTTSVRNTSCDIPQAAGECFVAALLCGCRWAGDETAGEV